MSDAFVRWTGPEIMRLKELHKETLSYTEIGMKMGRSKSAISGMVDRLGLHRPARRQGGLSFTSPGRAGAGRVETPPQAVPASSGDKRRKPVIDLTSSKGRCQWMDKGPPLRDFCNAPTVVGCAWCPEHKRRVYACKPQSKQG